MMWDQYLIDNRDKMLNRVEEVKLLPQTTPGTYLHLGCGPNVFRGFRNVDKFHIDPNVENFDMFQLPCEDCSVDGIYSSHALEHLPFRHAKMALIDWGRVLKKGGKVYLAIPDLEAIMKWLLECPDEEYKWTWIHYTLFGFQTDPNEGWQNPKLDLKVEQGQFHTCGFTKTSIQMFMEKAGLTVETIYSYDGWNTPSIWVEAKKKPSDPIFL